jgi:TetR/AcrR family transcriptional regulator, transcriptional repressor for nem operon
MSGTRQFDADQAVERATRLFWAKGYSNASVRDLLKVMKIGEGSFYNTFKSKKRLYLLCLKHYHATVTARRFAAFYAAPTAQQAVRRYLEAVLDDLDDPRIPNVCLMAGSLSSDVLGTRELRDYVLAEMRSFEQALIQRLDVAKAGGELSFHFDSKTAADVMITYLQGLFRVVRVLHKRPEMERQIGALLKGLGL